LTPTNIVAGLADLPAGGGFFSPDGDKIHGAEKGDTLSKIAPKLSSVTLPFGLALHARILPSTMQTLFMKASCCCFSPPSLQAIEFLRHIHRFFF